MTNQTIAARAGTGLCVNRFLASVRAAGGERPHPASLSLSRQPRATGRGNRRLAEFLRIDRGRAV